MRNFASFEEGPGAASSHASGAPGAGPQSRSAMVAAAEPALQPPFDLRALRDSLRAQPGYPFSPTEMPRDDAPAGMAEVDSTDAPTNVYFLARYTYEIAVSPVTMADHELGLMLPRSGRIWFNARLFADVPSGRDVSARDAWWRVVDTSPVVRFLLGWCLSVYGVARFRGAQHEQLPGWSRLLHFSPTLPECSNARAQLWGDVIQEVTNLFAPPARVWRQLQMFAPIRTGDHRWHTRLALANYRVEDVLAALAERNNCPATLIRRTLDGNGRISTYADYLEFAAAIMEDLPVLKLQRSLAMRLKEQLAESMPQAQGLLARLPAALRPQWISEMEDPRYTVAFWQLHL